MKAKINGRDIEIPVTWGNITLLQHNKLKKANNDFEAIEILTGITQDELKILSHTSISLLTNSISFIYDEKELLSYTIPDEFLGKKIPDIKKESWGQKIILQRVVSNDDYSIEDVLSIYFQENKFNIDEIDSTKKRIFVAPYIISKLVCDNILSQLETILKTERENLNVSPTSEQVQAGIGSYDVLGVFCTIDALANGDILKHEEILKTDYNTIYLKMLKNKIDIQFERNYSKVMARKK